MWPFSKRSISTLKREHIDFLNTVDYEYMRAYAVKSTTRLNKYLSRECAVEIGRAVYSINSKYFGSEKFRDTTWTLITQSTNLLVVLKEVEFSKVRVAGSLSLTVADDYKEIWRLDISNGNLCVCGIEPVSENVTA